MNQLIHCINCDAIFLKTPFDQEPEYEYPSLLSFHPPEAIEKDDYKDFMKDHEGHRLEDLSIIEDSFVSERDYVEPVKVSYFRATNGKDNFVIRKFREKIGDPLRYELIAGDYSLKCISLEIQRRDIEKQLAGEFKERPLSKNKIDSFLKLYEHIVKTVDVENLERVPEESRNPLEVLYKMDEMTLMYLLRNCHHIFKGQEYAHIEEFINCQKDDGVLLLKATCKLEIVERAILGKRLVRTPIPSETHKVKEMI